MVATCGGGDSKLIFFCFVPVYCRYASGKTFQGRWTADGDTSAMVIMVFDNSYSCLRPKTLAYKVGPR